MKEMRRFSVVTVVIIGLLLSAFVLIRADIANLFNNEENKPSTNNNVKDDDKDDDDNKDNDNNSNPSVVNNYSVPVITLLGDKEVTIEIGSVYVDAGAKAKDSIYGDLTSELVIVNNVDSSKLGTFIVTYNVTNEAGRKATAVTRTVKVVDTTPPEIFLNDSDDLLVEAQKNSIFNDPTIVTIDDNSKEVIIPTITYSFYADDITSADNVVKVDAAVMGNYIIHYNAVDSTGNKAVEVTRTVIVNDTLAPVINFSREGTVEVEPGAYVTVTVNDFSPTVTKYYFQDEGSDFDFEADASLMHDLPENGIIKPTGSGVGVYRLYVKSVDALKHESIRISTGTFQKSILVEDPLRIVGHEMNLVTVDDGDNLYSYINYSFTFNNFLDEDVVKITNMLFSSDPLNGNVLLATNTIINDDELDLTNPYDLNNAFRISGDNHGLVTYLGNTVINTMTGYILSEIPDTISLEVVTVNHGIYTLLIENDDITWEDWKEALYLSVVDMTVDEIVVGETGLELDVAVNKEVQANKVTDITVELYSNDLLLATNKANEEFLNELKTKDDSTKLTDFTTTFYLNETSTDPSFDMTVEPDGYTKGVIPDKVKITVDTLDESLSDSISLNLTDEQVNNWNDVLTE